MFDQWDRTTQTGQDTEYSLVVLALCVGVGYLFAQFLFRAVLERVASASFGAASLGQSVASSVSRSFFDIPIPLSPPSLPLRI
jgi:hypothetical protein